MARVRLALPDIEKIWEQSSMFRTTQCILERIVEEGAHCREQIAKGGMTLQTQYIPDDILARSEA